MQAGARRGSPACTRQPTCGAGGRSMDPRSAASVTPGGPELVAEMIEESNQIPGGEA